MPSEELGVSWIEGLKENLSAKYSNGLGMQAPYILPQIVAGVDAVPGETIGKMFQL